MPGAIAVSIDALFDIHQEIGRVLDFIKDHRRGKGGKEPAPGVYGFIETPEYWEGFQEKWNAGLRKYNVPYFHFRELNPPERAKARNPYYNWDKERVDDFIYDMAIIASEKALPFGGNASIKGTQGESATSYTPTYKIVFEQFSQPSHNERIVTLTR